MPWRRSSLLQWPFESRCEEELAFEAEAETLEQRLEVRLARIEAQLAGLDARLQAWTPPDSVDDAVRGEPDEQQTAG